MPNDTYGGLYINKELVKGKKKKGSVALNNAKSSKDRYQSKSTYPLPP